MVKTSISTWPHNHGQNQSDGQHTQDALRETVAANAFPATQILP